MLCGQTAVFYTLRQLAKQAYTMAGIPDWYPIHHYNLLAELSIQKFR